MWFVLVLQEYSTTLYLRQIWRDDRLAFAGHERNHGRSVTLHHRQFDRMWTPDVFIRNLKNGLFHTITVPNRLIRLSPDGTILYSQRRNLKNGLFHTITVPNRLIRLSPDGTILYSQRRNLKNGLFHTITVPNRCLLYTSDAADE